MKIFDIIKLKYISYQLSFIQKDTIIVDYYNFQQIKNLHDSLFSQPIKKSNKYTLQGLGRKKGDSISNDCFIFDLAIDLINKYNISEKQKENLLINFYKERNIKLSISNLCPVFSIEKLSLIQSIVNEKKFLKLFTYSLFVKLVSTKETNKNTDYLLNTIDNYVKILNPDFDYRHYLINKNYLNKETDNLEDKNNIAFNFYNEMLDFDYPNHLDLYNHYFEKKEDKQFYSFIFFT